MGICGGAFLASVNYDLGLLNAEALTGDFDVPGQGVQSMAARGVGSVEVELTALGRRLFAGFPQCFSVDYTGGPIISRGSQRDLPDYAVLAEYRSEVWQWEQQRGTMINTPAIIAARCGSGCIVLFSAHPEMTAATRSLFCRGSACNQATQTRQVNGAGVMFNKAGLPAYVAGLLAVHAVMIGVIACQSPTMDEAAHLAAGVRIWHTGRCDLYRVNPPLVRAIAALPAVVIGASPSWDSEQIDAAARPEFSIGIDFVRRNGLQESVAFTTLARIFCIPFSLLGGYICWRWAKELYGRYAGLVALLLWCFSPNVLACSSTICPDAAARGVGCNLSILLLALAESPFVARGCCSRTRAWRGGADQDDLGDRFWGVALLVVALGVERFAQHRSRSPRLAGHKATVGATCSNPCVGPLRA